MSFQHRLNVDRCKGCGICVAVCPKKVLALCGKLNAKGYFPVYQAHSENCVFCTACAVMCPDMAICIVETASKESCHG